MGRLDAAPVRPALPDTLRITDDLLFFRVVFRQTDHAGLLIPGSCLPVQRHHIFPPVPVVKQRSVKPCGMQIDRLAPGPPQIFCRDQVVIHVKIPCIHGIHHTIHHIKQIFLFTVGQAGCPDSLCRREPPKVNAVPLRKHMAVKFPVLQISRMVESPEATQTWTPPDNNLPLSCRYRDPD